MGLIKDLLSIDHDKCPCCGEWMVRGRLDETDGVAPGIVGDRRQLRMFLPMIECLHCGLAITHKEGILTYPKKGNYPLTFIYKHDLDDKIRFIIRMWKVLVDRTQGGAK